LGLIDHGSGGWWLETAGARTKTGAPIELPFPTELLPALKAYLVTWQPQLARPEYLAGNPALWLTQRGTTSSDIHLDNIVVARTRAPFRQPVSPYLFRTTPSPPLPWTARSRCAWRHVKDMTQPD
jgi:hypothetical protein